MWQVHTREYYSVMKMGEVVTRGAPWESVENTMLNVSRQTARTPDCTIPFTGNVQNRARCRGRGGGKGIGSVYFMRMEFPLGEIRMFWNWTEVGWQSVEKALEPLNILCCVTVAKKVTK
jgi:hypothetical protein